MLLIPSVCLAEAGVGLPPRITETYLVRYGYYEPYDDFCEECLEAHECFNFVELGHVKMNVFRLGGYVTHIEITQSGELDKTWDYRKYPIFGVIKRGEVTDSLLKQIIRDMRYDCRIYNWFDVDLNQKLGIFKFSTFQDYEVN
jgi:hypothetical protein